MSTLLIKPTQFVPEKTYSIVLVVTLVCSMARRSAFALVRQTAHLLPQVKAGRYSSSRSSASTAGMNTTSPTMNNSRVRKVLNRCDVTLDLESVHADVDAHSLRWVISVLVRWLKNAMCMRPGWNTGRLL